MIALLCNPLQLAVQTVHDRVIILRKARLAPVARECLGQQIASHNCLGELGPLQATFDGGLGNDSQSQAHAVEGQAEGFSDLLFCTSENLSDVGRLQNVLRRRRIVDRLS